jgi:uncharacterized protein YxjI
MPITGCPVPSAFGILSPMHITAAPGEKYTIRKKVFKLFGESFHVYDANSNVVAFANQKAFRLREDLRVYTGEDKSKELIRIGTQSIIDFSATYTVALPDGSPLGLMQRKGMRSSFVRDEWIISDATGKQIAFLREAGSTAVTIARRWIELAAAIFPQTYEVHNEDGTLVSSFRQHFNPFVFKIGVTIHADDPELDELMLLAIACLIAAIEGRQE